MPVKKSIKCPGNEIDTTAIGSEYITDEKVAAKLLALSDDQLVRSMLQCLDNQAKYSANYSALLGFLGACSHLLVSRSSILLTQHTGIPFREFSFLHRVFDSSIRAVKMLPAHSFSEGIYYDEKLNKQAFERIIACDLPELHSALRNIVTNGIYQQRVPVANNTRKSYSFYYDECHLNFLRYACQSILELHANKDIFESSFKELDKATKKLFTDQFFRSHSIYFLKIGEAFVRLSAFIASKYKEEHVSIFKKARNILAHPERASYSKDLNNFYTKIVDMMSYQFRYMVMDIYTRTVEFLKLHYGYVFNVEPISLDYFPKFEDDELREFNPALLPVQVHHVITAYENLTSVSDRTNSTLALAFKIKDVADILDTSSYIQYFISNIKAEIAANRAPDYYDCLSYIDCFYDQFTAINLKKHEERSKEEVGIWVDFKLIYSVLMKKLISRDKDVNTIKYRLYFYQLFKRILEYGGDLSNEIKINLKKVEDFLNQNFFSFQSAKLEGIDNVKYLASVFDSILKNKAIFDLDKCLSRLETLKAGIKPDSKVVAIRTAINAGSAANQIEKIANLLHEYKGINNIYEAIFNSTNPVINANINKFRALLFGSIAWYYIVVMGSLSGRLVDNVVFSEPKYNNFRKFMKIMFKAPRSDLAHNQLAVIGDPEYLLLRRSYHEGIENKELIVQGPTSRSMKGVQQDEEGNYFIESSACKYFPAAHIRCSNILNHEIVLPVFLAMKFLSKQHRKIYLCLHILRDEEFNIAIKIYFVDMLVHSIEAFERYAFLRSDFVTESLDKYKNKQVDMFSLTSNPGDIKALVDCSLRLFKDNGVVLNRARCVLFISDKAYRKIRPQLDTDITPEVPSDRPALSRKRSLSI